MPPRPSPIFRSFSHAWRGLLVAFRTEQSFRIQVAVGVVIIAAMFVIPVTAVERLLILVAMGAVLVLELINSMVERLVDLLRPRLDPAVADIKDIMAATVLLASGFAVVLGFMIFWPYLTQIISRV